jgi:periplasmic divalent cation tolerance protein
MIPASPDTEAIMSDYCVILTTSGSQEEADRLAAGLVEARLAACVQQTPIRSTYRWEGEVVKDEEILLLIKSRAALFPLIEAWIQARHSYDVPEIVMLPVTAGLKAYLDWVEEETDGN